MTYANKHRQFVEKQIARYAINTLIEAGFYLTVHDGVEDTIETSQDAPKVFQAMFGTDGDWLVAYEPIGSLFDNRGWIRFIYGNDGVDVISDYTVSTYPYFDTAMAKINAWVDHHEEAGFFPIVPLRVGEFENIGSMSAHDMATEVTGKAFNK